MPGRIFLALQCRNMLQQTSPTSPDFDGLNSSESSYRKRSVESQDA
ncbi:hypothetical protein RSSM_05597 [Rhodopirellula sallentina SM41]|uniref:Uncharacterized protein n=1 Tax=Rhodopirellula sallentina SM41 TaxID=1263870 RepID=M5TV95_9BACT|nr:hypothetical protein RSSM_05597 [Rhodopirellula sallentina SM41]